MNFMSRTKALELLKEHESFNAVNGECMINGDRAATQAVYDKDTGDYILTIYTTVSKGGVFVERDKNNYGASSCSVAMNKAFGSL